MIQIRFLVIEDDRVYLLGLELKLTKTEYKLLYAIATEEKSSPEELLTLLKENAKLENVQMMAKAVDDFAVK